MQRPRSLRACCLAAFAALAIAAPAAAIDAGGDVSVPEDLHAVLTLRGKPCEGVVSHRRLAEADYEVVCSDGPRYRIRVDSEQRVVVEELEPSR